METLRCGSLTIFLRLVELFQDIDADANGTISFTEWISALLRVRKANYEVLDGYKKVTVNRACNSDSTFRNFHLASIGDEESLRRENKRFLVLFASKLSFFFCVRVCLV